MTLQQILDLLAQAQAAVTALQAAQSTFTQADLDAAVAKAKTDQVDADAAEKAALQAKVEELTASVAALQSQVDGIGPIVAGAVGAENVRVLGLVKDLLDGEEVKILAALALPTPTPAPDPAPAA